MYVYRWLVAMALASAFSKVAYAESVSLYTAPMLLSTPRKLVCLIANVGDRPRTVTILPNGAEPATTANLAPGQSTLRHRPGNPPVW
jgi:hypothetical protein